MSTRTYRVALLGYQDLPHGYSVQCTLKLYDLCTEEISTLLEKVDLTGFSEHEDAGLQAVVTYEIQGGGRLFPPVSRQAVSQAMQGVEILVAVVSSHQLNWIYWEVFECMIEDNLMKTCTVVLKLLEIPSLDKDRGFITVGNALQNCGLIGDKWRGNAYPLKALYCGQADSSKMCSEDLPRDIVPSHVQLLVIAMVMDLIFILVCFFLAIDIIAEPKLGGKGIKDGIEEVKIKLLAGELTENIARPVKETLSAGKTFIKAGHTFVKWFQRHVK